MLLSIAFLFALCLASLFLSVRFLLYVPLYDVCMISVYSCVYSTTFGQGIPYGSSLDLVLLSSIKWGWQG